MRRGYFYRYRLIYETYTFFIFNNDSFAIFLDFKVEISLISYKFLRCLAFIKKISAAGKSVFNFVIRELTAPQKV